MLAKKPSEPFMVDRLAGSLDQESSRAGESHPHSLTEPYVNVSAHTALITQPTVGIQLPNVGIVRVSVWQYGGAN